MLRYTYLALALIAAALFLGQMNWDYSMYLIHLKSTPIGWILLGGTDGGAYRDTYYVALYDPTPLLVALTHTIWVASELRNNRVKPIALLSVLATLGIGVSCGLPLYLYFRFGGQR